MNDYPDKLLIELRESRIRHEKLMRKTDIQMIILSAVMGLFHSYLFITSKGHEAVFWFGLLALSAAFIQDSISNLWRTYKHKGA